MLAGVELLRLCAVLEDSADQLTVLGHLLPHTCKGLPAADMMLSGGRQRGAELSLRTAHQSQGEGLGSWSHREMQRALDQNHLSPSNLAKVHRDRQFAWQVISSVLLELREKQTFVSLLEAVEEEKRRKAELLHVVIREQEGRRKSTTLQRQLVDIRRETSLEVQRREELTAHLKDQVQEMMVKTSLKRQYITNSTDLQLYQTNKLNNQAEKSLDQQIKMLHARLEEERRVHQKTDSFLKEQLTMESCVQSPIQPGGGYRGSEEVVWSGLREEVVWSAGSEEVVWCGLRGQRRGCGLVWVFRGGVSVVVCPQLLGERLEVLMEGYEHAVEGKQQELCSLRSTKAHNLGLLQDLARKYRESEQVVMDDRMEKENLRRQLEREQIERNAVTKVQAWWRGCLVRRGLGPFKKGKKAKEGKKKGKKKP
ncbi:dynein regulatory complex protein 9 [Polymixia lowei]